MLLDSKEEKQDDLERNVFAGAASEVTQRYGAAAKEYLVAYSGVDNENGKTLTKSLKSIHDQKTPENKNYTHANNRQKEGFVAEVQKTSRDNAENIINKKTTRTTRTDDIGRVNDPLFDHVEIDIDGNVIDGSGSQMKFVGNSPDELLDKLKSKKFQKYLDADAKIDIPDEDYEKLIGNPKSGEQGIIDNRLKTLESQRDRARNSGNEELANKKQEQIDKLKKIKNNLRKSGVSRKDAEFARAHPKLATAKEIAGVSHRAGVEQAKIGATVSGGLSLIRNTVACIKGEKDPQEAAKDVVIDTGTGAVMSYATGFAGTAIKGTMQNAKNGTIRNLSKTNLPATLVTTTVTVGKVLKKYISGEIDGVECVEELGQEGVGMISSSMFAALGSGAMASLGGSSAMVILGGIVGATFGYAGAVACYQIVASSLKEAKLAEQERIRVEAECEQAIQMILEYRREMDRVVSEYLSDCMSVFSESFMKMDEAILLNDTDGFIQSNADLQRMLGKEVQFSNQKEFNDFMNSDVAFKL